MALQQEREKKSEIDILNKGYFVLVVIFNT